VAAILAPVVLSFIMDFLIPIPMFLSHYVFSNKLFTAWVVISFIWVFGSLTLCGLLPIIETRRFFKQLFVRSSVRERRVDKNDAFIESDRLIVRNTTEKRRAKLMTKRSIPI
jgi:hypothetical protein